MHTSLFNKLKLSIEDQFITQCLRLMFSSNSNNAFAGIDFSALRWEMIYEKSLYWHVAPLLYRIIQENQTHIPQFPRIPAHFLDKLKMVYIRTLSINRKNYEGLAEILEVLGREGIRVILLKGIYLAEFIYDDIGVRPMGDVDLLVQRRDIEKAESLLLKLGYQYQFEKGTHPLVQKSVIEYSKKHSQHLFTLACAGKIPNLEVHSHMLRHGNPFRMDDGLWKRAVEIKPCGSLAWALAPEDNLIYLSLHATYAHGIIDVLKSYVDIGMCIQRYGDTMNWNTLIRQSGQWKMQNPVYLALRICHEISGAPIPPHVLQHLKPESFSERFLTTALMYVFLRKTKKAMLHAEVLYIREGAAKKIMRVFRRIFISRWCMAHLYSVSPTSIRVYFYYIVRLISVLYRYGPGYFSYYSKLLSKEKGHVQHDDCLVWLNSVD